MALTELEPLADLGALTVVDADLRLNMTSLVGYTEFTLHAILTAVPSLMTKGSAVESSVEIIEIDGVSATHESLINSGGFRII